LSVKFNTKTKELIYLNKNKTKNLVSSAFLRHIIQHCVCVLAGFTKVGNTLEATINLLQMNRRSMEKLSGKCIECGFFFRLLLKKICRKHFFFEIAFSALYQRAYNDFNR
jgi:hypothetical protein